MRVRSVAALASRVRRSGSGCAVSRRTELPGFARKAERRTGRHQRRSDLTEEALILELRRTRRLGIKRLRHELHRLHGLQLSPATIYKTLVRHALNVLPRRKRDRHKPRRYSRPVPGDRVQMDTYKIQPGLYQFTAVDDCSRYLVAGLARRRPLRRR